MILETHLVHLDMRWLISSDMTKRNHSSTSCSPLKKMTQPAEWDWRLFCGKEKNTTTQSIDLINWPIQHLLRMKTEPLLMYSWATFTGNERNGTTREKLTSRRSLSILLRQRRL